MFKLFVSASVLTCFQRSATSPPSPPGAPWSPWSPKHQQWPPLWLPVLGKRWPSGYLKTTLTLASARRRLLSTHRKGHVASRGRHILLLFWNYDFLAHVLTTFLRADLTSLPLLLSSVSLPVVSLEKMPCLNRADSASHVRLTSSTSPSPSSLKPLSLTPPASQRSGEKLVNGRGTSGPSTPRSTVSPSSLDGRPSPARSPLDRRPSSTPSPSPLDRKPSPSPSPAHRSGALPSSSASPLETKHQNGTKTPSRSQKRLSGQFWDEKLLLSLSLLLFFFCTEWSWPIDLKTDSKAFQLSCAEGVKYLYIPYTYIHMPPQALHILWKALGWANRPVIGWDYVFWKRRDASL